MSQSEEEGRDDEIWHEACRIRVADCLKDQGVVHGRIGDVPAWSVPRVMSVWAVESVRAPGRGGGCGFCAATVRRTPCHVCVVDAGWPRCIQ